MASGTSETSQLARTDEPSGMVPGALTERQCDVVPAMCLLAASPWSSRPQSCHARQRDCWRGRCRYPAECALDSDRTRTQLSQTRNVPVLSNSGVRSPLGLGDSPNRRPHRGSSHRPIRPRPQAPPICASVVIRSFPTGYRDRDYRWMDYLAIYLLHIPLTHPPTTSPHAPPSPPHTIYPPPPSTPPPSLPSHFP